MIKYFFSIFLFFILFSEAQAQISTCETTGTIQQDCLNIIDTAVPLLNANFDAVSGGMGEVGIALSSKTNAVYYNSAKMIFNENEGGISLSYAPWLRSLGITDIFLAKLGGFYKLDEFQAIGGSIRYFSFGEITFTDFTGIALRQYKPREMYIDLAYSGKLSEQFAFGATVKYIHSDLAKSTWNRSSGNIETVKVGRAIAVDLSAFYTQTLPLSNKTGIFNAGLTISNIGNKISYIESKSEQDFLPTNLGIGFAYDLLFENGSKITFAYDLNKLLVPTPAVNGSHIDKSALGGMFSSFTDAPFEVELNEINHSLGIESYIKILDGFGIVRTGLFREHQTKGNRNYFTVGLGYKYEPFEIAISRVFDNKYHPLNKSYKFTLLYNL